MHNHIRAQPRANARAPTCTLTCTTASRASLPSAAETPPTTTPSGPSEHHNHGRKTEQRGRLLERTCHEDYADYVRMSVDVLSGTYVPPWGPHVMAMHMVLRAACQMSGTPGVAPGCAMKPASRCFISWMQFQAFDSSLRRRARRRDTYVRTRGWCTFRMLWSYFRGAHEKLQRASANAPSPSRPCTAVRSTSHTARSPNSMCRPHPCTCNPSCSLSQDPANRAPCT